MPSARRRERAPRPREERPRSHVRGQRCHDIRCQEADEEIREAFGRFGMR
jgi:hypothetical protein